jgi:hypothetical protein
VELVPIGVYPSNMLVGLFEWRPVMGIVGRVAHCLCQCRRMLLARAMARQRRWCAWPLRITRAIDTSVADRELVLASHWGIVDGVADG